MFSLAWNVRELDHLNSSGRNLCTEISVLTDKLKDPTFDRKYLPHKLEGIKIVTEEFIKGVTRQQRVAATHCLVIMISPEGRNRKPYAFPVQCLPYKGLKDKQVREITNKVVSEMTKRGMKVAGMQAILSFYTNVSAYIVSVY